MTTSYECILTDVRGSGARRTLLVIPEPRQPHLLLESGGFRL